MSNLTNAGELLALAAVSSELTSLKVALLTVVPTDEDADPAELTSTALGYARQPVTFDPPTTSPSGKAISTPTAEVKFDPAGSNWGTIEAIGIVDESTSPERWIWFGALVSAKTVNNGDVIVFAKPDIELTMD